MNHKQGEARTRGGGAHRGRRRSARRRRRLAHGRPVGSRGYEVLSDRAYRSRAHFQGLTWVDDMMPDWIRETIKDL